MGVRRKVCCICGLVGPLISDKKACASWRKSSSYEKDFECCFGPAAEERSGDVCTNCKTNIFRFRGNKDLSFSHVLDSKDTRKIGRPRLNSAGTCAALTELNVEHNYSTSTIGIDPPRPSSPEKFRKRTREEDGPPKRQTRPREDRRKLFQPLVNQPIEFLGHLLPGNVVTCIVSFLTPEDCLLVTSHFIIPALYAEKESALQEANATKILHAKLKEIPKTGPLTQPQKLILQDLIVNRENNVDESGCIIVPQAGSGGKPKHYLKVPKAQKESSKAAKRTKNRRSQIIEQVEKICSTPEDASLLAQRVNNIKRDLAGYAAAAEEAGLKVVAQFNKKTVLALRGIMTLRMWRVLKRVFKDEVGWDVFGSVEAMQREIKSIEFEYECGTVTSSCGDVIHFVRVADMKQVITQLVSELQKANQLRYLQNLDNNSLWIHTSADKGGKSTKLILQVINQKDRHSIDFAKLIGYFEGKDNRVNMEAVFGPLFENLQQCASNIAELSLLRPLVNRFTQPQEVHSKDCSCDETMTWVPPVPFDESNPTISDDCKYCKRCPSYVEKDKREPIPDDIHVLDHKDACGDVPNDTVKMTFSIPSLDREPHTGTLLLQPSTPLASCNKSAGPKTADPIQQPQTPSNLATSSVARGNNSPHIHLTPSCHQADTAHGETPRLLQSTSSPLQNLSGDFTPCRAVHADEGGISPRNLFPMTSSPVQTDQTNEPVSQHACSEIYTECRLTVGGDWEGCAKLLGLSGPNGKHFCNHCLVILGEVRKGVPHAAHILPKYQAYTNNNPSVLPNSDDFLRTFERCNEKHEEYVAAGAKAKVMNYENCENKPMVSGGKVIDTFSTTPLHISLGIGLQVLNVIEEEALQLDKQIKDAEGQYDAFTLTYEHKKDIQSACQAIKDKIDDVDDKVGQVIEKKKGIIRERASFFKKNNRGRFVNNSDLARGVREQFANLDKEKATLIKDKEKLEKQLSTQENKLSKIDEELNKIKGPFKTNLDKVLDSMKLKRAAYHSGALIGPDVKKLITDENIPKLAGVFKPMTVQITKDGCTCSKQFSTHQIRVKVITLLQKFKQCYDLYTANRTLCRHEVEHLAIRCASFGCWFPVNYPEQNLKRKFHLLTVDVPKQARRMQTTGMITEQTIESIHPYINELDRRFAKVADKNQKGLIICKQQNMYSQPAWNSLKKRSGKKC